MNNSIYYHFFDRELRKSVDVYIQDEELLRVCCLSVFMTDNILYLPISNLYESGEEFPETADFIKKLDKVGLIYPASSHETREGFILSRQEYYSHDRKRYPMYFEAVDNIWSPNLICLKESTTKKLENYLKDDIIEIKEFSGKKKDEVRKYIDKVFKNRKHEAITLTLFTDKLNFNNKLSDLETRLSLEYIKQRISVNYTKRYLEIQKGTIITGITGLRKYDFLAKDAYDTNFPIYQIIAQKCGLNLKKAEQRKLLFNIRMDECLFRSIYLKFKEIIALVKKNIAPLNIYSNQAAEVCLKIPINYPEVTAGMELYGNLERYIQDICFYNKFVREDANMGNDESIVLIAVTSTEMKIMIQKVREYFPSYMIVERIGENLVYREVINEKQKIYLVQSEMGNVGVGSIVNTLHLVCEELKPKYVIMGGIAFGSNIKKQGIGDILVSKQVWYYERAKLNGDNLVDRGDKVPASAWLLRLFRSSELEYGKSKVHFGLIASGEKLVNSPSMLGDLETREPELIGGDMEAAGMVSVCEEKRVDWIFAKGISDWGMNKGSENQEMAAEHSFDFIMYNLKKIV